MSEPVETPEQQATAQSNSPSTLDQATHTLSNPPTSTTDPKTSYAEVAKPTGDSMIDPELIALPPPTPPPINGSSSSSALPREPGAPMTIIESIASAPNPRTTDFTIPPMTEEWIDIETLDQDAQNGTPGSPAAKLMKVIAPPNATQAESRWPAVSLYLVCFGLGGIRFCGIIGICYLISWRVALDGVAVPTLGANGFDEGFSC